MRPPTHLKEAQHLTGCMADLGLFISKLGEKGPPLVQVTKEGRTIRMDSGSGTDIPRLKKYLSSPDVLVAPHKDENLLWYGLMTPQVVSAVLVVEWQEDTTSCRVPNFGIDSPMILDSGNKQSGPRAETPEPKGLVSSDSRDVKDDPHDAGGRAVGCAWRAQHLHDTQPTSPLDCSGVNDVGAALKT